MISEHRAEINEEPMPAEQADHDVAVRDGGFWREAWLQVRLVGRLLTDRQVPFYLKLIPIAAVGYLFVPLDLLPDAIIGLGQLDDLGLLLMGARVFIDLAPADVVARHRMALANPAAGTGGDKEILEAIVIDQEQRRL